ncbi:MAG: DUF2461 domain-containing protein [Vulcanimicrobiaceae bacterium]
MTSSSFDGFSPTGLALLRDLAKHNDRTWFAPRKERFERELLAPMRALVDDTSRGRERAKIPLRGDAKRSIFRIYRDVRFGHDKSPYKTHVSAYLSYDGGRDTPGGIYVHVQPKRSFLAVAFYRLEKPMLERWRRTMLARPAAFTRVLAHLERRGIPLVGPEQDDDSLARMPRGFDADAAGTLAPYFRLRSFCVDRTLADDDLSSSDLVTKIVKLAKDARPLLDFGWSIE